MTPSFSGFIYLFYSFTIGFFTYRWRQYWQKEKTYTAKIFFYFGASMILFCLITAIGGIFFPNNLNFLKGVVISATFFQGLALSFLGALIVYLKFPQVSPNYGFLFVFLLGLLGTILTGILPSNPYLKANNWIEWDIHPIAGFFRALVFASTLLPLVIILIQQFLSFKEYAIKMKSLGLALIFLVALFFTPFYFILKKFGQEAEMVGSFVLIILIFTYFTQRPFPIKLVKKERI